MYNVVSCTKSVSLAYENRNKYAPLVLMNVNNISVIGFYTVKYQRSGIHTCLESYICHGYLVIIFGISTQTYFVVLDSTV